MLSLYCKMSFCLFYRCKFVTKIRFYSVICKKEKLDDYMEVIKVDADCDSCNNNNLIVLRHGNN